MDEERRTAVAARVNEIESLPLAERADGYGQLLDALRTELEAAPGSAP